MPLEPGDRTRAPDVTQLDQHGEPFLRSASSERRKAPHLMYVVPGA